MSRIAIGGISIECLPASPLPITSGDIQVYQQGELLGNDWWLIRGMEKRLSTAPNVEIVPLLWATALPGGVIAADAYAAFKQEFLSLLERDGPFDGVCLAQHGAMEVEGLTVSGDTDFITSVRAAIGADVPLAIAFDLHGNLTPEIVEAGTVFSALRTAPHRDDSETGYRAADQLLNVIERNLNPQSALVQIPILMPGERAVTDFDPTQTLYATLDETDALPGVMQSVLMVGFGWSDRAWTGMSTLFTTENDPAQARQLAQQLANQVWAQRENFGFTSATATIEDGVSTAVTSSERPFFLSDGGDNTTAGTPGDLTFVLQHMLQSGVKDALVVGICAPQTVEQCHTAGVGAQVELKLGSEHVSQPPQIMPVTATVEALGDALNLGGFQPYRSQEQSAWAKVRINDILVTFHARPVGITTPAHIEAMSESVADFHIVVVKLGYLHPQLGAIAARHILLLSPGSSDFDLGRSDWQHVRRPIFPLDTDMPWQADA